MKESPALALKRWAVLEELQKVYPLAEEFVEDGMAELGFDTTEVQKDITRFVQYGPQYLMVQAQRGQAKTTCVALFAIWDLIHNPAHRVLIVSAGGTQANEISTLICRLIMSWDILECLRPDKTAGDRTSVEAFDVHHSLKGLDKSPSVACVGITSNMQGKRADLLIPDDVESGQNSRTEHNRQQLLHCTLDFVSLCTTGRIIYLGTPQSRDSIYNTLPGRGFTVRIWTGRYPTNSQLENYGTMLAPYITKRIQQDPSLQTGGGMLGDQGQPIDPDYITEQTLQKKEMDQGPSYFQLQHMLNTRLSDMDRYPLKVEQLLITRVPAPGEAFPVNVTGGLTRDDIHTHNVCGTAMAMYRVRSHSPETSPLQGTIMYVDPAGGGKNGDETAYAVVGFLNGKIWVLASGGVPGGFSNTGFERLTAIAKHWKINLALVEKNFGHGALLHAWLPFLHHPETGHKCAIEETWESGQKELRIIDILEPVLARGALIINEEILSKEPETLAPYSLEKRSSYSVFHQLARITRDPKSLTHDDRLDALAGAVRYWVDKMGVDHTRIIDQKRQEAHAAWIKNPLGLPNFSKTGPGKASGSLLNRFKR